MYNRISFSRSKVNPDLEVNYGDCCELNGEALEIENGVNYLYYTYLSKCPYSTNELSLHEQRLKSPVYTKFRNRSSLVVYCDWEFQQDIKYPESYKNFDEAKKIINETHFVIGSFYLPDKNEIRVYEHPDINYGKIGSWLGESILTSFINGAVEVDSDTAYKHFKGKGQITGYEVKLCHFFSAFDVFGCFRSKEIQRYIASQLEGGRVLHGEGFSNVRTNVYFLLNGVGYELTLNIVDFKGYAPTGGGGTLENTFKSQGMIFDNKELRKGFDIERIGDCYMNEDEKREVNGVSKSMSDWVIDYTFDDGTKEMFEFLFLIHKNNQKTINNINPDYQLEYARTLGNIANQAGIAAISKQFGYDMKSSKDSYNLASMQYLSSANNWHSKDTTNNYLIATAGGMCKNFQPRQYKSEGIIVDIDWKGFYPSIMKVTPYCVGVPIVIDFHKNEIKNACENFNKHRTIAKLIKKTLSKNLVPGAWKARVTTKPEYMYKFRQNLILSFMVNESSFEVKDNLESDVADGLPGCRLRNEIPCGAITLNTRRVDCAELTFDYIDFIDNYWTPRERKEFYENTLVDSIIFYDSEMELYPQDFKKKYEQNDVELKRVEIKIVDGKVIRTHFRNNYWCRLNTNDEWLGILDDRRSSFKKLRSEAKKAGNKESEIINDALQNSCKTINNGTAGVTMSADYQTDKPSENRKKGTFKGKPKIGNVVFGANITAAGRIATYCLAMVSRGHLIITDGTPANLNSFMTWDWYSEKNRTRVGADSLYSLVEYENIDRKLQKKLNQNNVKIAPINGAEWIVKEISYSDNDTEKTNPFVTLSNGILEGTVSDDNCDFLNTLVYDAVVNQFSELSIFKGNTLNIEIKNVYKKAIFQSQANYMFVDFADNTKIKARGYEVKKPVFDNPILEGESSEHPFKDLIKLIGENKGDIYQTTKFQSTLHGVGEHNKTSNVNAGYEARGYLPHCASIKTTTPRPISLSMFYYQTWKQRKLWHSLDNGIRNRTDGFGIEIICMSLEQLIKYEYLDYSSVINELQDLIDSMPIKENGKAIGEKRAIEIHRNRLLALVRNKETLLKEHNVIHPNKRFKNQFNNSN